MDKALLSYLSQITEEEGLSPYVRTLGDIVVNFIILSECFAEKFPQYKGQVTEWLYTNKTTS